MGIVGLAGIVVALIYAFGIRPLVIQYGGRRKGGGRLDSRRELVDPATARSNPARSTRRLAVVRGRAHASGREIRKASSSTPYHRFVRPRGVIPEPVRDRHRRVVARVDDGVDPRRARPPSLARAPRPPPRSRSRAPSGPGAAPSPPRSRPPASRPRPGGGPAARCPPVCPVSRGTIAQIPKAPSARAPQRPIVPRMDSTDSAGLGSAPSQRATSQRL